MGNAKCPGCGMMVADPLGHLAHGMAQATETPTFGGKSLDQVVKEAASPKLPILSTVEDVNAVLDAIGPAPTYTDLPKPKNKGGRPRKA